MTKIQVLNSRTRKWILQTIFLLAPNERNLWGGHSNSSSTDTRRVRRVKHLAQGHTISDVTESNFKTKFACSESYLHGTKNRTNLFQNYILGEKLLQEIEIKQEALECISCVGEMKESIMKINCT